MSNKHDDAPPTVAPSQELSNDVKDGTLGFLLVGVVRAAMVGLKKGAISSLVRKQAFLQISSLTAIRKTTTTTIATDTNIVVTSTSWKEYSLKLLKNAVLGIAVFGTYDFVAFEQFGSQPDRHQQSESMHTLAHLDASHHRSLVATSTPVFVHAGAGLAAGIAHSGILVLWNIVTRRNHPNYHHHWTARRLQVVVVHHSLGYACLFGTYEATRRLLEYSFYDALVHHEERVLEFFGQHPWNWRTTKRDNDDDDDTTTNNKHCTHDLTPIRWTMAFVAGGVAGYVHQLVLHAISHSSTGQWGKMIPTLRPSPSTVWFTGLCFMAFEFGGEWTERTLT